MNPRYTLFSFKKVKQSGLISFLILLFTVLIIPSLHAQNQEATSVMVVRGGHPYDTPAFEEMCQSLDGINVDLVLTAHFNAMKLEEIKSKYDAILFLNQNKYYEESKRTKEKYVALTEEGVGMVFLHFTLSSQPNWDQYHDIVGGKWFLRKFTKDKTKLSTYFIDLKVAIKVLDSNHPVTKGITDFEMTDVFYGNIHMEPEIHSLLGSDNPNLAPSLAWTQEYNNSKIVYIMPGYSEKAYTNPSYKKLVANALSYVGN